MKVISLIFKRLYSWYVDSYIFSLTFHNNITTFLLRPGHTFLSHVSQQVILEHRKVCETPCDVMLLIFHLSKSTFIVLSLKTLISFSKPLGSTLSKLSFVLTSSSSSRFLPLTCIYSYLLTRQV